MRHPVHMLQDQHQALVSRIVLEVIACDYSNAQDFRRHLSKAFSTAEALSRQSESSRVQAVLRVVVITYQENGHSEKRYLPIVGDVCDGSPVSFLLESAYNAQIFGPSSFISLESVQIAYFKVRVRTRQLIGRLVSIQSQERIADSKQSAQLLLKDLLYNQVFLAEILSTIDDYFMLVYDLAHVGDMALAACALEEARHLVGVFENSPVEKDVMVPTDTLRSKIEALAETLRSRSF